MRKRDFSGLDDEEILHMAKKQCLNILKQSDKTEKQLRQRLKEGGFPPFAVEGAIAYAASYHYINDERYVANYLEVSKGKKSRKKMEMDLMQRGADRELILQCMGNVELDDEKTAYELLKKKMAGKNWNDPKQQRRMMQYLVGQGYSYETIKSSVYRYEQFLEDEMSEE